MEGEEENREKNEDEEDEEEEKGTFSCKLRRRIIQPRECLILKWVCDGFPGVNRTLPAGAEGLKLCAIYFSYQNNVTNWGEMEVKWQIEY